MPRTYIRKIIREKIKKVAGGACEYCKAIRAYSSSPFAIEHIVPIAKNGSNKFENLAYSCNNCNLSKSIAIAALDPVTKQKVFLFHPRNHIWENHFKWTADFLKMEGLTPTGRATIIQLKTNRLENINLRTVLLGIAHPPD